MMYPQVLTIAGSDSGGGAGIQADIKTFTMRRTFATSVITATTAQNTLGVTDIHAISTTHIAMQCRAVADDFDIRAVKIGMLGGGDVIECVAGQLRQYDFGWVVLDLVMIAKGGAPLLPTDAIAALIRHMIPLADIITPNLPETLALTGVDVVDASSAQQAAQILGQMGAKSILIKGGHRDGQTCTDWAFVEGQSFALHAPRHDTPHTHGTGCSLSACIAAELAHGADICAALHTAKRAITAAISQPLGIGSGHGAVNHWAMWGVV